MMLLRNYHVYAIFMCTNGAYVMDKEENRSLFHVTLDKEQALYLLQTTYELAC